MSARKHTLFNVAGQLVPLACSFLAIPPYIALLGEERFGIVSLVWLFTATMALFDLGMGQAVAQRLASDPARSEHEKARFLFCALIIAFVLGIFGAATSALVGYWYVQGAISIADVLRAESLAALPWAIATVPIATVSSVLFGVLQAHSRFGPINIVAIVIGSLAVMAPFGVAIAFGASLDKLVAAIFTVKLCGLALLSFYCKTELVSMRFARPNQHHFRQLIGFGGWSFVSACVGPLLVVSDRFLIGVVSGAQAVSRYTVPFQLAERVASLGAAVASVLMPRLAAIPDPDAQRALTLRAMRIIVLLSAPLTAIAIAFVSPFLSWWISPDFAANAVPVAQLLCAAFFFNGIALTPHALLLARGKSNWIAYCHLAELAPYFATLYFALFHAGIFGAAVAFALRVVADLAMLCALARLGFHPLKTLLVPSLLLAFAATIGYAKHLSSAATLSLLVLALIGYLIWAWPRFAAESVHFGRVFPASNNK